MAESTLAVEHLFTITAKTAKGLPVTGGPQGSRVVVPVTGGSFKGARLEGTVAEAPGGDWVTVRADGSIRLDVRILLQTNDGANILVTYSGIGNRVDGELQLRTAPQFETGDERYAWLNNVQAVGIGTSGGGEVQYEVYRLL
ncbi:MAG: DUF3237 domain-containing protein [Anaerolinea sp.]|nr:DUF3237 domain-containing protein [Anaerolinea sp.]